MEYLVQSGIKGMRWGVRRYQNPDGSLTPAGRERYLKNNTPNDTHNGTQDNTKSTSSIQTLTNQELRDLITRMKLEQEYAELTKKKKTPSRAGKMISKYGGIALGKVVEQVASAVGQTYGNMLKTAINNKTKSNKGGQSKNSNATNED